MEKVYILHMASGIRVVTEAEAIQKALDQEAAGIVPHCCLYDYGKKEKVTPPGWLVWSTYRDGCGVVYRRDDGKMVVCTGMQGDFVLS